jgi:hypothetical protein
MSVRKAVYSILLLGLGSFLLVGCAARVSITSYPGMNVDDRPLQMCKESGYQDVQVIGLLPEAGTFEEIGYMTVKQAADTEFEYTSTDKQVEAARVQACQWGADAIVILDVQGDKGSTRDVLGEPQYHDERESRIVAIRFIEPTEEQPGEE